MDSNSYKASVLTEALPYIKKYIGKTIVIKYGGNAMIDPILKDSVISDIVLLAMIGVKIVLVHGGGPEITEAMSTFGIESKFIDGLRYTDDKSMEIIQMVLCGKTNKNLVAEICKKGGNAVGLSGLDAGMAACNILDEKYGNVGEIKEFNTDILTDLLIKGYIPVVSTVGYLEGEGEALNINADTFASRLSVALKADKLMLLTDVCGVLRDFKDAQSLIPAIHVEEVPTLIEEGIIKGGMIPKVDCCVYAVKNGVKQTTIQNGMKEHSILVELLSDSGSGTMFY